MIPVYLAGPYQLKSSLLFARDLFVAKKNHFHITSRWLDQEDFEPTPEALAICASKNYEDISKSRVLVVLNSGGWVSKGTGGRHVEVGYAVGRKIPVISYGFTDTAMYYHPLIVCVSGGKSWQQVMEITETVDNRFWFTGKSLEGIGEK